MLQVTGAILVLPVSIKTESGLFRESEDGPEIPAVIQMIETGSGQVQVVIPAEDIDEVIKGLEIAKEGTKQQPSPKSDLYIPNSNAEVEQFAKSMKDVTKNQ